MGIRTTGAAAAAVLLAVLTACGSSGKHTTENAGTKPSKAVSSSTTASDVDCSDQSLDQATWMEYCADKAGTGGDGTAGTTKLAWGKAAQTVGAQSPVSGPGGGDLEVTPTTVLYAKTAQGFTAANGLYAIITVKDRATGSTAAAESAPIESGGWQWIAPDGQALDEGENDASSITPSGFTGGGMTQAGTYQWDSVVFDLSTAQRGGTLSYIDGAGAVFHWTVPATDSGPQLAAVKKGIAGDYS